MSMESPKVPVDVVFRIGENPMKSVVSGMLAEKIVGSLKDPIYAIMPYADIVNAGWKQADMVRCYTMEDDLSEEVAVEWTTIVRDTKPATPEEYNDLLLLLEAHGYEVSPMLATSVDHATRKMVKSRPEPQPDISLFSDNSSQDVEFVSERIEIEFDVVNDNVDAESGVGSDKFKEEWA